MDMAFASKLGAECSPQAPASQGTAEVEAVNSEEIRGTTTFSSNGQSQQVTTTTTFNAKWIAPTCSRFGFLRRCVQ